MYSLSNRFSPFGENRKLNHFLYFFIPFVVLSVPVVYMILTDSIPFTDSYYSLHYILTYDHGFVGRGLVGEIISWFVDDVSQRVQQIAILIFTWAWVLAGSLCIGRSLRKCESDKDRFLIAGFLILIVLLSSFSTGCYYEDVRLDKLVWAITFFSVFLVDFRPFRCIFVPILSAISILVSPVFFFSSMPLIGIIMLDKFQKQYYSFFEGVATFLTFGVSSFFTAYSLYAHPRLGFANPNEFIDFYFARTSIPLTMEVRERFVSEWLLEYFSPSTIELLKNGYNTYFVAMNNGSSFILSTLFVAIPLFSFFTWFWNTAAKSETDRIRKCLYYLCSLSLLIIIPMIISSWEAERYYGYAILAQICMVIYFIGENDAPVLFALNTIKSIIRKKTIVFTAIFSCYAAILLMVR